MDLKGIDYPAARGLLTKAIVNETKEIKEPINVTYTLECNKWLKDQGILQSLCDLLEIGQPKGRTMLSGCIAFAVYNEGGRKVAFYGLQMKDRKPKFHSSFNLEHCLCNFHRIGRKEGVWLCTDVMLCVRAIAENRQAVPTFGLPYLSAKQMDHLNHCKISSVFRDDAEIVRQVAAHYKGFVRFIG